VKKIRLTQDQVLNNRDQNRKRGDSAHKEVSKEYNNYMSKEPISVQSKSKQRNAAASQLS